MLNFICLKTKWQTFINNCYIIHNKSNNHALLIDPSWEITKLRSEVNRLGCTVDAILLTHSHFDHINLSEQLSIEYNCPVFIEEREIAERPFRCQNIIEFSAPNEISTLTETVKCILTPGHTTASVSYIIGNFFVSGDTVFNEGCGLPDCEDKAYDLYWSINNIKKLVKEEMILLPGHSYGTEVGQTMEYVNCNNIYFSFNNPKDFVSFLLRDGLKSRSRFT